MGDTNNPSSGPYHEQSIPGESVESGSTVNLTANPVNPVNTVVDMPNSDTTNVDMNMDSCENRSTPASSPPSYNSLFGRVRTASTKLRQTPPGEKPVNPVPCMLVTGFLMSIPVAHIVIGSLYLHFCRLEKMVPTFLVVFGVFTILAYLCSTVIAHRIKSGKTDDEDDYGYAFSLCCLLLIGIFLVVWLITGSVYLYGSYTTWNTDISLPTYCIPTLYYYAFWTTTIFYSIVGLSVIIGICAFCIKIISSA